jgi:hypothetical protein
MSGPDFSSSRKFTDRFVKPFGDYMPDNTASGWISTAALALVGFALIWMFNMNAGIAVLEAELKHMQGVSSEEERQERVLSNHWRLHSAARDEINKLLAKEGLPLFVWPELDRPR